MLLRRSISAATLLIVLIATLVIVGWFADSSALVRIAPSFASMKIVTAVGFLFSSVILYGALRHELQIGGWPVVLIPSATLALITLVGTSVASIFLEVAFDGRIGISGGAGSLLEVFTGLPSLGTLAAFLLVASLGLVAQGATRRRARYYIVLATAIVLLSATAVVGYIVEIPALFYAFELIDSGMALHTALLFLLIGLCYIGIVLMMRQRVQRIYRSVSLRARLTVMFVLMALIPLAYIGIGSYISQRRVLIGKTVEQLTSLADVQEERVNEQIDRYLHDTKLVASRTRLRALADALEPAESQSDELRTILLDARNAVLAIKEITIYTSDGSYLGSTAPTGVTGVSAGTDMTAARSFSVEDVYRNEEGGLEVRVLGPLLIGDRRVGFIEVRYSADSLLAITEDYSGLGATGEVLLVQQNAAGDAVFMTPLRFDAGAALQRAVPKERDDIAVNYAARGEELALTSGDIVDYRGIPVFAVTRYVEATQWGVVVKVDRFEALQPAFVLLREYIVVAVVAISMILLISWLTTRTLTRPLEQLTLFAQNLQSGNFSMRTQIRGTDEIGYLATTMNEMAEKVESSYGKLEERVEERTKALAEAKGQLEGKLEETERLNRVMVNRELKMIELKKRIAQLEGESESESSQGS